VVILVSGYDAADLPLPGRAVGFLSKAALDAELVLGLEIDVRREQDNARTPADGRGLSEPHRCLAGCSWAHPNVNDHDIKGQSLDRHDPCLRSVGLPNTS